jgi:hypothetical protein
MTLDLKRFCHSDPDVLPVSLQKITAPWSEGDHTYATDGRVIVRVTRRADVPAIAAGAPNNVAELLGLRKPLALVPFGGFDLASVGTVADEASIDLRGGIFNLGYVRLLSALPQLRLEYRAQPIPSPVPGVPTWKGEPIAALRFVFGGEDPGEGLLMPRRGRAERHVELIEEPLAADVSAAVLCWPLLCLSLAALAVAVVSA